jgi:hypothetical protein
MVVLYPNTCLIVAPNQLEGDKIKDLLMSKFELTVDGLLNTFLGLQIEETNDRIRIYQCKYAMQILDKSKMPDFNTAPSSMIDSAVLIEANKDKVEPMFNNQLLYMSATGLLMYLVQGTRPDLAFAVSILSCFAWSPSIVHWKVIKPILCYMHRTDS